MSKGSRPRPLSVSLEQFNNNLDKIFGEKPKRERYVPPPLPDMTEDKKESTQVNNTTPDNGV